MPDDMNLGGGAGSCLSVEAAIRLLAWHVEQLVKDGEAKAELRQLRKDMELLTKTKQRSTPDFLGRGR